MKKKLTVITLLLAFCVTAVLIGCGKKPSTQNNQSNNTTTTTNKTFTVNDLKAYTGQNGQPAYVAVDGTVYDVTHARKWRNGQHEEGIVAGVDLTNVMGDSPHGKSVLKDVPTVGKLK